MAGKRLNNADTPASLLIVPLVLLVAAVVGGCSSGSSTSEISSHPSSASANSNTTRFGAAEPAPLAASIALAVYPSSTPAQRPTAVTLVGEDWKNAVAAAVLMAPPIRAPLLISAASGTPGPSTRALETLNPQGQTLKRSGNRSRVGHPAYAIGPIATPTLSAARTAETSGAPQAAEIEALRVSIFREQPQHVVVAPESDPAFAVPAAAWAARSGDAVLYSRTDKLPAATAEALKSYPEVPVYVLGPSSAISSGVVREIAKIDRHVKRVAGETPAENAIALARYSDGSFGWNVNDRAHGFVIASSDAPLDAALAAPLSASGKRGPLLLTEGPDRLPKAVREYLLDVKPAHVWVIGDEEAIDPSQQAEIDRLAG